MARMDVQSKLRWSSKRLQNVVLFQKEMQVYKMDHMADLVKGL